MGARSLTLGWSFVLWGLAACTGDDSKPGNGTDDSGTVPPPTGAPADMDLDGVTEDDGDCDDFNAGVYPGAAEACDGIDNNCNSETDEGLDRVFYTDLDVDGYGNVDLPLEACKQPAGSVTNHADCNDNDAAIHPGAMEVCDDDDVDEDCDTLSDLDDPDVVDARTFYVDADGDGYGEQGAAGTVTCDQLPGTATNAYDCNDGDAAVNPNMLEVCDGQELDDDCDGLVDDADPESLKLYYWPDDDNDGYGDQLTPATYTCFDLIPSGYELNGVDCDDDTTAVNPAQTELCGPDHVDDDCDGDIDEADSDTTTYNWYVDADDDGYGETGTTPIVTCQIIDGYAPRAGDCRDDRSTINPGQDELCNTSEVDEDCDGKIDEADPETPAIDYFIDTDGDGFGDSSTVLSTCDTVTGRVTFGGDCDEGDTAINPGAFDDCEDDVDNDCDGSIDNCSIGNVSMSTGEAIIIGDAMESYAGGDLSNLGDVNGDGLGDMALGAFGASTYTGKAGVFFGPVSGSTTMASADVEVTGAAFFDQFGWSIAGERDVNDDGAIDMIIGGQSTDAAYLYYGPITADATAATADATFTATYTNDQLGWGVDLIGDWDGDGFGESVAMAPQAERAAGFYATGVLYVWTGPVSGSMAASTADWILGGSSNYDNLTVGYARAAVGDINGDGVEEIAASAPYKEIDGMWGAGEVNITFGGSLSPGTYDITASDDVTITGEDWDQLFGYGIADRADYDGDGYHDLVASSHQGSTSGDYSGLTYVFYGPMSGDMLVSDFDTRWEGDREEFSGRVLASGGDFNEDGMSDVLIGSENATSPTCMWCGGAYLVMGGVEGDRSLLDDSFAFLEGSPFNNAGTGVAFIDDWDSDDRSEVSVSAQYAEIGGMYGIGTTSVWTGGTLYP
jgi:hypothetical protein